MQQKSTSLHIKQLWEQDIFKPKWVVIAKAYSTIRGEIGISNAPLDVFLGFVCPAIGIIGVDQYLAKMNWEVLTAADGATSLKQTTAPDISSFEEHLVYTNMTEWDLIAIAIVNNYIPQHAIPQNQNMAQQGVFPATGAHMLHQTAQAVQAVQTAHAAQGIQATPAAQAAQAAQAIHAAHIAQAVGSAGVHLPHPAQQAQSTPQSFASRVDFFRSVATDPVATASVVLGFDVKDMLRVTGVQQSEWTGSLADVYDPETGYYDMDQAFEEGWNVGNINEPLGFDSIFADSIRDGYIIPAGKVHIRLENISSLTYVVPDFDGENPDYM